MLKKIEAKIQKTQKKLLKFQNVVAERQAKSKADFPGKTILEVETMEDWIDMASLYGELKALKSIKRMIK